MRHVWQNRKDCSSRCESCPGCEAPYPLGGVGAPDEADIMLVGQEPAYNIDMDRVNMDMSWGEARRQFIEDRRESLNPLWKHMMNVAIAAECSPEELYFTNLAKCNDGDSPWSVRADHCQPYLAREVGLIDPDVLLLYGSKVIQRVFEMFGLNFSGSVGDVHTEVFETNTLKLIPLYHWGYPYRKGTVDEYNEAVREVVQEVL